MTGQDIEAIAALTDVLRQEIAAIRRGDLSLVGAHLAQKTDLSTVIEAAGPAIATALAADPPDDALKAQITMLCELIDTDRALLERMTHATSTMVAEIARIRDRHGLCGIYGAKGTARGGEPIPVQRFDQSV